MVTMVLPLLAEAGSSAQQDYLDAASSTPDLKRGEQLFVGCAKCHGADGGGDAKGNAPRIAGQLTRVIIRQLVDYRYDNRRDPLMEPVARGHLLQTAQDTADLAAFVAALRPRAPPATGRSDYLEQAGALYSARCSACHGGAGQGDEGAVVPRLAGQHYAYLLRQFHDAIEGRRPMLARSHDGYLKDLDRDSLQGLADLLSRMARAPQN
jgi:cytochrome c553